MAGDWIKMRTDLYRDPKVCVIADILGDPDGPLARHINQNERRDMTVTRNALRNVTVGALVSVWGVMRHRGKRNGDDLRISNCTLSVIDDVSDLPGFGDAMAAVGWAVESDKGVVFPRFFEEFNVDPADEVKAKNAERQRRFRAKKNANERNVTVTVKRNARGEKSRGEKSRGEKSREEAPSAAAQPTASVVGVASATPCPPDGGRCVADAASITAVFEHYRTYHAKAFPRPAASSKEWRLIQARLREGFTVEDLRGAIDGNHRSPFHCGENDRNREYHSLELIVRDGSKVQQFLDVPQVSAVVSEREARTARAGNQWLERMEEQDAAQRPA